MTYFSLDHPAAGATYWKLSNAGDWSYYDGTAWNATGRFLLEPPNAWFHGFGIHAGWEVYNYTSGSYYTHEYALYWQHVDDGTWKYYDGASWYGWWPNIGQFAASVAGSQDQYVPVSGWPLGTLTDYPPGFGNEVFIVGIPSNGTLWHDADGNGSYETALDLGAAVPVSHVLANRIVYSGNANWAGDDSFSYALFEGDAGVVVPICIASVPDQTNQEPVANADSVTAQEDLPLQISLTGDDGDPNVVQALTYFLDSLPGNGALYGSEADARAATNPLGITQLAGNTLWYSPAPMTIQTRASRSTCGTMAARIMEGMTLALSPP